LSADDQRIVEVHDEATTVALRQLEFYAATRIRKKGQTAYRTTGNLVGAVFRHNTSRAFDPHLHSHCIVFNATLDSAENCWKALEPYEMLMAKKFVENVYYHELVRALNRFGYRVQNKPRGDFDIEGVSPELIKRFSKRHEEIDRKTAELQNRQPEKAGQNINEIREHIAHRERARKIKNVGLTRLQSLWHEQMSDGERTTLQSLPSKSPISPPQSITAEQAVTWAEEHLFERHSVVREHDLWRHALEHARRHNIKLGEIQSVTKRRKYVRDTERPDYVTSRDGLEREWPIVKMARDGCGAFHPLNADYRPAKSDLDGEQREALERILLSCNYVTLFRGGAGTGKSHTLREVVAGLRDANRNGFVIARASKCWGWKRTVSMRPKRSVRSCCENRCRLARWCWWMKPDRLASGKCCNFWSSSRQIKAASFFPVIPSSTARSKQAMPSESSKSMGRSRLSSLRRFAAKTRHWRKRKKNANASSNTGKRSVRHKPAKSVSRSDDWKR